MKINQLYILLFLFAFIGCDDDSPDPVPIITLDQVLVLNEGNFLSGNGTIDAFDLTSGEVENAVYEAAATIQTAREIDDNVYLVANAPDRVDVLNKELTMINRIDLGLDNPIDVATVGNRAYITNWGNIGTAFSETPDSYVAIVDLDSHLVIDSVMLSLRPQRIIALNGLLYIANEGGASITVLDPLDLSTVDVVVPDGPSNLIADNNERIWVLCTSGSLVALDSDNLVIEVEISGLVSGGFNEKMALNSSTNMLYFLGGSNATFTGQTTVYQVDLDTEQVTPLVQGGFAFYGVGVNSTTDEIFVGDSNAFQSTGTAFRYDAQGNLVDQFATGIGPNGFVFF